MIAMSYAMMDEAQRLCAERDAYMGTIITLAFWAILISIFANDFQGPTDKNS